MGEATKCAVCGTSLLDKPRINDMCLTCDYAVHHKGDMSLLEQGYDDTDDPWRGE